MNHPLGDFVASLPAMSLNPVSEGDAQRIAAVADEIRRVRFELPPDVESLAFIPLGIDGYRQWRFIRERNTRPILIVSPFLSGNVLNALSDGRQACSLISRPDIDSRDLVIAIADRLVAVLRSPYLIDGAEVIAGASIGISFSGPSYEAPGEVLRDADLAMYKAKGDGKSRYVVFDEMIS